MRPGAGLEEGLVLDGLGHVVSPGGAPCREVSSSLGPGA